MMVQTVNGKNKEYPLRVYGKGFEGCEWSIGSVKGEKISDLLFLNLHPTLGLEALPAFTKAAQSVNSEDLLSALELVAMETLPGEFNLEGSGSVFLAVAIKAIGKTKATKDGVKINQKTTRSKLTTKDWIDAYLEVERQAYLPAYCRNEFITVTADLGLFIEFPVIKVKETKTKETQQQQQQQQQPSNVSSNGHGKISDLVTA